MDHRIKGIASKRSTFSHVSEPNVADDEADGRKAVEAEPSCKLTNEFVSG